MQPGDDGRLQYCLASWKAQRPFDNRERFLQRLTLDNLTENDLCFLIAEPSAALRRRLGTVPHWIAQIDDALSLTPTFEFHEYLTDRLKSKPTIAFLDVAASFIDRGLRRLTTSATELARRVTACPFDPAGVGAIFFPDLARALLTIVERTMVLELNVARVEDTLDGDTPDARFESFVAQLRDPVRIRTLLEEYPVLARLLAEHTDRWVMASMELLERLSSDVHAIQEAFGQAQDLGRLVRVYRGGADPHGGGRSVTVVGFSSAARVVYKPKSVAVDAHFQEVLQWMGAAGFSPAFRRLTILDRGDYGWVEFVSPAECLTRDDVVRFYERIGGYLALLYVMEATDVHAGNVIAAGEHPLLIDLEALFHPHRSPLTVRRPTSADRIADRSVRDSVLRIGLLPERVWGNAEHEGVDISGLGGPDGQLTPHAVPGWEAPGTDAMRLVRKRRAIEADHNRPILEGQPVDAFEHREAILEGFRSAYSILAGHRAFLLSTGGPLRLFAQDPVSVFLRSSRTYRRLLRESFHPDVLRDALDRDRLFDHLWVEVTSDADLMRVIRSERDDLWTSDIPRFTTRPDSRDLWSGAGEPIANFFPESSLSAVQRIVDGLSEQDCARQTWYIEASLASLPSAQKHWPSYPGVPSPSPVSVDRLLAVAGAIASRLEALAVRGADDASWVGLQLERRRVWSISPAGLDLGAGLPGIALFLAYVGAVTGRRSDSALAGAALATMGRVIKRRGVSHLGIGGFDGLGGVIYALSHLGSLWNRDELISEAERLAMRLPDLIASDEHFDLFGGAAGCILALRSLYRSRPSDHVTAAAVQCGHHLLRAVSQTPDGIGWPRPCHVSTDRTGLVFSDVGIAYALLELGDWTRLDEFRVVGNRVGLSRLWCSTDEPVDSVVRCEWVRHAEAVRARGVGSNHSLGHGDLGGLECLGRVATKLGDTQLTHEVKRMMATILGSIDAHGWRCGTPLGVETPGLLTGLAGIGYALLRIARPDVVPCVLALEAPYPRRTHGS